MANKLVSQHSSLCVPSNLCLFNCPETQVSFQKNQWLTFVPAFKSDSNGPFVFHLQDSSHFLQLNKTYISFRLKLEHLDPPKEGGPKIENTTAPAQLIGCSLFNQVRVAFNNVQLYDSTHYAYKSYLQTLLGCTTDEKHGFLSAAGWFENDAYHPLESVENKGFVARQKCFKNGEMDVCALVLLEPFLTDRLLVPGVNMQLTFYRNNDNFVLENHNTTPSALRLTVYNMKLHVRAVEVNPSCALAIESKMRTIVARYPFTDVKVKILTVPAGRMDMPFTSLYHDVVPRRLIIGLLEPDAMEGHVNKDCFNFKHFNLRELIVDAAGVTYGQSIESDFANKNYARTFVQLFEELGCVSESRCPPISYRQFANGQALFPVNLSALDNGTAWDMIKTGTTQLALKFAAKVPEGGINMPSCILKYLVSNAVVPCKDKTTCPGPNTCNLPLLTLVQLRGVFSPRGTHFEETNNYMRLLSSKILQAWNGFNGTPLKLPLNLISHSANTFRFPSRTLRRNRRNCIPTLAEYIMARYGVTVSYPDAYTVIDANGSILPIEAVQLTVTVQSHPGQITRRAVVEKELELCQLFDTAEQVVHRRGIINTKEEQEFITEKVLCKQFELL